MAQCLRCSIQAKKPWVLPTAAYTTIITNSDSAIIETLVHYMPQSENYLVSSGQKSWQIAAQKHFGSKKCCMMYWLLCIAN